MDYPKERQRCRIACPRLVKRFIDPDAEFLYVPAQEVMAVAEENDHLKIALESPLYDALYAWCQRDVARFRPAE